MIDGEIELDVRCDNEGSGVVLKCENVHIHLPSLNDGRTYRVVKAGEAMIVSTVEEGETQ